MRVNGINSYANVQAFRGTEAATGEEKAEKKLNKKAVAGIAAGTIGAAAVGVSLLAYTKGRKLNGAEGKIFQNVADGFKEIGKEIVKLAKSVKSKFGKKPSQEELKEAAMSSVNQAKPWQRSYDTIIANGGDNKVSDIIQNGPKLNTDNVIKKAAEETLQ